MVFPRNTGELKEHSCFGIVNDDNDETIAIWLKIENGKVTEASFTADDCITCTACASAVTEMAWGKTTDEVLAFTAQDVIDSLQGLPDEDHHCAELAVETIKTAVKDYLER